MSIAGARKSRKSHANALTPDASASAPQHTSLLSYSPALVLLVIAVANAANYADPDLWWHLRSGQEILRLGHLVRYDPYSYSAPGHLWLNEEWLSDVVMAAAFNLLGVFGLHLMKLACAAVTIAMLSMAAGETGATPLAQFGILIVAAIAITLHMQFRPQLFTFAFAATLMWMLARDSYRRKGPLWPAIPMLALWANLHGAFLLGIFVLATYATIAGAQDLLAGRGWNRALRLYSITACAMLATLATPYGILIWEFLVNALTDPLLRSAITEWFPLYKQVAVNLNRPAMLIYYASVVAMSGGVALAFAMSPSADDLALVAIAILMAVSAAYSLRNVPLAAITAVVPLAHHVALIRARSAAVGRSAAGASVASRRLSRASEVSAAIGAIVILWATGSFATRLQPAEPFPVNAVDFMLEHKLKGNVLCYYNWGGYLIFHGAPDLRVFVDGRFDTVYPREVLSDYLLFQSAGAGAVAVLDAYPHDFVLIPPSLRSAPLMRRVQGWKLIYNDNVALVFARANSAAAQVLAVPSTPASSSTK